MALTLTPKLRATLIQHSKRLHAMGWVANHDGNLSVRLTGNRLLITATAMSKADIDEASLLVVDMGGRVLEGRKKPFSELDLHLAVYAARPSVNAVVHAHPPYAAATALAGQSLMVAAMPEVVVSLGAGIPTAPLWMPKTPELSACVGNLAKTSDAMLLTGNGALTFAPELNLAYLRMELVEHYAKIVALARQMGGLQCLSPEQVAKLLEARKKAGLMPEQQEEAARKAS